MNLTERIHSHYTGAEEKDDVYLGNVIGELVPRLEQFQVGEYYRKTYPVKIGTQVMQQFLDSLIKAGLDIGKGDSTFGYKMPLPPRKALWRDLIIFRRK